MYLLQMNVKGAYLNAPIGREIYVQQPKGYEQIDSSGSRLTCHLQKSLFGPKQSGRNWNATLTNFSKSIGFIPNQADSYISTSVINCDQITILLGLVI